MAVGEIQPVGGINDAPAIRQGDALRLRDELGELRAVSARVHQHAAADGAGDAAQLGHAGKPLVPREGGDGGQRRARLHEQAVALAADGVQAAGDAQHQPADAAVAHQQVGAVADDRHRRIRLFGGAERNGDFIRRVDVHHHLGRAADAQGGILRHRGLRYDALRREIGLNQRLNQGIHQTLNLPADFDTPIVPHF